MDEGLTLHYEVSIETPAAIAHHLDRPNFLLLLRQFLYMQHHNPPSIGDIPPSELPYISPLATKLSIHHSAVSVFFAPSDLSGTSGMRRERIRAVPAWRRGPPRYDTVLISTDREREGMLGLDVARVHLFFSFSFGDVKYPCTLIDWYDRVADTPDEDTGMWVVKPTGNSVIVHIDSILRCAHLVPVFDREKIDRRHKLTSDDSLDAFQTFYINKYADHHMHEVVF